MVRFIIAVWAIQFLILAPATAALLHWLSSSGQSVIVSNYDIPAWLLSPKGASYVLLFGVTSILGIAVLQVGLFWIASAGREGRFMRVRSVFKKLAFGLVRLASFSLLVTCALLITLAVSALAGGIAYLTLLTSHDINYYLSVQPTEWYVALAIAGIWALICFYSFGCLALRCLHALPLWLRYQNSLVEAFKQSWAVTRGRLSQLLCSIGGYFLVVLILYGLMEWLLFVATGFALNHIGESISGITMIIATFLSLSTLLKVIFYAAGTMGIACVRAECYGEHLSVESREAAHVTLPPARYEPVNEARSRLSTQATTLLVLLALLGNVIVSLWIFKAEDTFAIPYVIAHRAGAAHAPENTLAALKTVIKQGVSDYVEIDVQMTSDHEVVVAHDKDLMKIGNSPLEIKKSTLRQLREVDIGKSFGPEFEGEKIETLAKFLKKAKGKVGMLIEFKYSNGTDLIQETIRLIRKYEMEEKVVLASLELSDVREVQKLAPEIPVGYFASYEVGDLTELDVNFLAPKDPLVTPRFVRSAHEKGLTLHTWTVDDPTRMVDLIELGVDGIITNDPVLTRKVIDQMEALGPENRLLLRFRKFWDIFKKWGVVFAPGVKNKNEEVELIKVR
jgi:glycerophosphoryl diester phosphodiesterase